MRCGSRHDEMSDEQYVAELQRERAIARLDMLEALLLNLAARVAERPEVER